MPPDARELAAMSLIVVTILGVAIGRYPWLRMNRASIALVGATALIALGTLSLEQAFESIDVDTLALLFAMMVINVNLRIAGFFNRVAEWVIARAHSPAGLLALVISMSGLLSALFLNDTIVLAFTPLVLEIVLALGRNPVPYLVALVTAANIGSVATIVGNPQNILIGTSSGVHYLIFTAHLLPVALAGLAFAWLVLVLVYRSEFRRARLSAPAYGKSRVARPYLLRKGLLAATVMLVLLIAGVPPPLAALVAASALLITRRLKPERVFVEIDWSLLVFFAGLFVVTGALRHTPLTPLLESFIRPALDGGLAPFAVLAAVVSNLVSNVPAVLLFRPVVEMAADPQITWLTLAMATTFAGNLTLLGSVANLIVAETARRHGVHLGFVEYLRAGVLITLGTLGIGIAWLAFIGG